MVPGLGLGGRGVILHEGKDFWDGSSLEQEVQWEHGRRLWVRLGLVYRVEMVLERCLRDLLPNSLVTKILVNKIDFKHFFCVCLIFVLLNPLY